MTIQDREKVAGRLLRSSERLSYDPARDIDWDAPEPGLRSQIEAALAPHAVRLAKIETSFAASAGPAGAAAHTSLDALEQLQPGAVFDQLYRSKYNTDTPAALSAAFAELLLADNAGEAGGV